MRSNAVLESAGVDMNDLKGFFRSHKRRASAAGLPSASLPVAPPASAEPPPADENATPNAGSAGGASIAPSFEKILSPTLPPSTDAAAAVAEAAAATPGARETGECGAPADEGGAQHSSSKKARRRRRQSFNMNELDARLREIAESGASPLPPMHGLPSPMEPMAPLGPPLDEAGGDGGGGGGGGEDDAEGRRTGTPPTPVSMDREGSSSAPPSSIRLATPAHVRVRTPLAQLPLLLAHADEAARGPPPAPRALVDAVKACARELCTFAELWHWEEEARLAARAGDAAEVDGPDSAARADSGGGGCRRARAPPRVRFCALSAACVEPPAWGDGGGAADAERAALHALLPLLHARADLARELGAGAAAAAPRPRTRRQSGAVRAPGTPAPAAARFLRELSARLSADELTADGGFAAFWRTELAQLAAGEQQLVYAARAGALVRSLVRHELRSLLSAHEAEEARALDGMPRPVSGGRVIRKEVDSVARLLGNALRVWAAHRDLTSDARVCAALERAHSAERLGAARMAVDDDDAVIADAHELERLDVELRQDLLDAADAHAALAHVLRACPCVTHASRDGRSALRELLDLGALVPTWVDEFVPLARAPELSAELESARAVCARARAGLAHLVAAEAEAERAAATSAVAMAASAQPAAVA